MSLASIIEFVGKYSPAVEAAISTVNPVAGAVMEMIAHAFGANPQNTNDILDKMSNDKDSEIKLKQIELQIKQTDVLLKQLDTFKQ